MYKLDRFYDAPLKVNLVDKSDILTSKFQNINRDVRRELDDQEAPEIV
jgi:hypothetical protein